MESTAESRDWQYGKSLYYSVALISLSVLMLEIGLARMFSVMFESHYVFLVLSLAILGLGAGGIFVYKRAEKISNPNLKPIQNLLPISSGLTALSILMMAIFIVKVSIFQHIYSCFTGLCPFFLWRDIPCSNFSPLSEQESPDLCSRSDWSIHRIIFNGCYA